MKASFSTEARGGGGGAEPSARPYSSPIEVKQLEA
jgi:hypothetical protein